MIVEIFSKLNNIEELRSCILVCKKFRNLILKLQKIMQGILITFKYGEENDILLFLNDYGVGMRNIRIRSLKHVPNLEELECIPYESIQNESNVDSTFSLPKLKNLAISGNICNFIRNSRDLNKLISLDVYDYDVNDNNF